MKETTTIMVYKSDRRELRTRKQNPHETYRETLNKELNPETKMCERCEQDLKQFFNISSGHIRRVDFTDGCRWVQEEK